jgi:hypothetical protein
MAADDVVCDVDVVRTDVILDVVAGGVDLGVVVGLAGVVVGGFIPAAVDLAGVVVGGFTPFTPPGAVVLPSESRRS